MNPSKILRRLRRRFCMDPSVVEQFDHCIKWIREAAGAKKKLTRYKQRVETLAWEVEVAKSHEQGLIQSRFVAEAELRDERAKWHAAKQEWERERERNGYSSEWPSNGMRRPR